MSKIHQEDLNKPLEFSIDHNFVSNKSSSQPLSVSEKYLEENYTFNKIQSDNIFYGSKNYITKYYKPSPNCKKNY